MARKAKIIRKTKETSIAVSVNLDGKGKYKIKTGIGFLDHMLEQLSKHSLIDLEVNAKGDTLTDVIMGKGQFASVTDGSLDGKFSEDEYKRAAIAISAPASAKTRDISAPMPFPAPVTKATRPSNRNLSNRAIYSSLEIN